MAHDGDLHSFDFVRQLPPTTRNAEKSVALFDVLGSFECGGACCYSRIVFIFPYSYGLMRVVTMLEGLRLNMFTHPSHHRSPLQPKQSLLPQLQQKRPPRL